MLLSEILTKIEKDIPLDLAEDWDNPGLQVGRRNADINKVYIALDATDSVLEHAVEFGADLLLTHHPLLIGSIKKVNTDDFHGRKILTMAEHSLAHYAMHTNFDVAVMADLCSGTLGLRDTVPLDPIPGRENLGVGSVGSLPQTMTVRECAELVKTAFHLEHVKVFGDPDKKVSRAAMCPGSGKSLIPCALAQNADVYITGDIGHHDGIDAEDQGLPIIDAGHYGLEHVYIAWMERYVREHFPELEVATEAISGPFVIF